VAELSKFYEDNGIIHKFTVPYSPESNGVSERKNRTLVEMVNCMLISSRLPDFWWDEALLSAYYILNRVAMKRFSKTPYEFWYNRKPNLSHLKVWGCLTYVRKSNPEITKLGNKIYKCVYIGYARNKSA